MKRIRQEVTTRVLGKSSVIKEEDRAVSDEKIETESDVNTKISKYQIEKSEIWSRMIEWRHKLLYKRRKKRFTKINPCKKREKEMIRLEIRWDINEKESC